MLKRMIKLSNQTDGGVLNQDIRGCNLLSVYSEGAAEYIAANRQPETGVCVRGGKRER